MNRRSLLAHLAASTAVGVSGCVSAARLVDGDTLPKVVSIESTDAIPPKYDLDVTVELERETVTRGHTALLRFSVENTGDGPVRVGDGPNRVYSGVVSTGDASEPGLLLIEPEDGVVKDPRCWKPAMSGSIEASLGFVTLEVNDTAAIEYEIWGQADNSGSECLPIGEFRFATTYHVERGEAPLGADDDETFEWGFDLSIARDELETEG